MMSGYLAIQSRTTIPKPKKFQSQVNLLEHVVGVVKENVAEYKPKNVNAPLAWRPPTSRGVVVIYLQDFHSTSRGLEQLPMTRESSLSHTTIPTSGPTVTSSSSRYCAERCGRREYDQLSLTGNLPDLTLWELTTPLSASTRWSDSRVSVEEAVGLTSQSPGTNTVVTVTVPQGVNHQSSPLQALAHEFLRTPEMAWMREVKGPLDFERWVERYPELRREELRAGLDEAERLGLLTSRNAKVQNFIKVEPTINLTDPRNIVPRQDAFMAVLGRFVGKVEHKAAKAPFLVKGLDLKARDKRMSHLMKFKRFIEIDYARFDMTINEALLEVERTIVLSPYPRKLYPEVHKAYDLMMLTKANSAFGTTYTKAGGRQSGDLTTSIGNGLLNRFAVWYCLRKIPRKEWEAAHEGDDGLIGCSEEYLEQIIENLQFLWSIGFQGKIDVYNDITQTSFCGRFLTQVGGELRSYSDPLRAMAKLHLTTASGDPKLLICAKAMSYLHTDSETPIIGPWAKAVVSILYPKFGKERMKKQMLKLLTTNEVPWFYRMAVRNAAGIDDVLSSRPGVVDEELRGAFAFRTGISVAEQLIMEKAFDEWVERGEVLDNFDPVEIRWVFKPNCHYNINPLPSLTGPPPTRV